MGTFGGKEFSHLDLNPLPSLYAFMQINLPQVIKVNSINTNQILHLILNVSECALAKQKAAHAVVGFTIFSARSGLLNDNVSYVKSWQERRMGNSIFLISVHYQRGFYKKI